MYTLILVKSTEITSNMTSLYRCSHVVTTVKQDFSLICGRWPRPADFLRGVQFRICYCLTEELYDRSYNVKASVLWRHGERDFIGFYWDPYEMSVTNRPSSVIEKYRYSSTYVRTIAVVHRTSSQPPPPKNVAIGRKSSYHRQTPPPHPTHTTHAVNCRKSETQVLYDRSTHVKASVQWRHVWCDFSPTRFYMFKISVTKLSEYCDWKVPGVYSSLSKFSSVVLQFIVSCTYKGCSHLTRSPPTTNAAHGRISD